MRHVTALSTGFLLAATATGAVPAASADAFSTEVGVSHGAVHQAALGAGRAGSAVVIGTTGTTGADFNSNAVAPVTVAQVRRAAGSPSYTVPDAGVLTSISHDEGPTGGQLRAVLLGPTHPRPVLGYTGELTSTASTLNTYPVRLPVAAGTTLGLWVGTPGMESAKTPLSSDDMFGFGGGDPTTTPTYDFPLLVGPRLVDISAIWEPDVDHDGYGDVSQDLCPQSAATHDACPAPDTRIKHAPKVSSTHRVTIRFRSSMPGSTFTCRVDKRAVRTCTSPFRNTYSIGKHKVLITATSPAGVVETTPAKVKFRVVRPSHRAG